MENQRETLGKGSTVCKQTYTFINDVFSNIYCKRVRAGIYNHPGLQARVQVDKAKRDGATAVGGLSRRYKGRGPTLTIARLT